jgi:hypothetical protein
MICSSIENINFEINLGGLNRFRQEKKIYIDLEKAKKQNTAKCQRKKKKMERRNGWVGEISTCKVYSIHRKETG